MSKKAENCVHQNLQNGHVHKHLDRPLIPLSTGPHLIITDQFRELPECWDIDVSLLISGSSWGIVTKLRLRPIKGIAHFCAFGPQTLWSEHLFFPTYSFHIGPNTASASIKSVSAINSIFTAIRQNPLHHAEIFKTVGQIQTLCLKWLW